MATVDKHGMPKKITEMTAAELREFIVPLGGPGFGHPMAEIVRNAKGQTEYQLAVAESASRQMKIWSPHMDPAAAVMMLRRNMPIPSMLQIQRDYLAIVSPMSMNRLFTVFGDASTGKSHMVRKVCEVIHPDGAKSVDCGGMNMRELFFRTVIDYGAGVREQLESHAEKGKLKQVSIDLLNEEFPGSVIEGENGKAVIDWEKIGAPRQKTDTDGKPVAAEDRNEAMQRAEVVLQNVYKNQDIALQSNAFGIKTVPGEIFESFWSGQPLFLDEFNKSKRGTLDAFQNFLQFVNGEIDEVTIYNPMAQAGDGDSLKSITLNRRDMRVGWHIAIAGNDATDGDTTQELSISMLTRLDPKRIGRFTQTDWEHMLSQVLTGMPLSSEYNLHDKDAKKNPADFSKWLIEYRKAGLTADQQKAIPPQHIAALRDFDKTLKAVKQAAEVYYTWQEMGNPESDLIRNNKALAACAEEIEMQGKGLNMSRRKLIGHYNKGLQHALEVRPIANATLSLDIKGALASAIRGMNMTTAPAWHDIGANMARAAYEDWVNATTGMPKTREAMISIMEKAGFIGGDLKEARPSDAIKTFAQNLRYDSLQDIGGTEELMEKRAIIIAALKSIDPRIGGTDDQIVPLENLGAALQALAENGAAAGQENAFVIPNTELNKVGSEPVLQARAVRNYDDEEVDPSDLADYRAVLAGLALPDYAVKNLSGIWDEDLMDVIMGKNEVALENKPAYESLMGQSAIGLNFGVLGVLDGGRPGFLYVIEDKACKKVLIMGESPIDAGLKSALKGKDVTYVRRGDVNEEGESREINDFITDSTRKRNEVQAMSKEESNEIISNLLRAISLICDLTKAEKLKKENTGNNSSTMTLASGSTLGGIMPYALHEPAVFTNIVRPAQAGLKP